MKAVILAGGLGTRISEETDIKPKPMIEIGKIEQHHREEVAEVMEFYETELNGSKND